MVDRIIDMLRRGARLRRDPPPELGLTAEQADMWRKTRMNEAEPSGQQTPEQAKNLDVAGYRAACQFMGVDPPSEAVIRRGLEIREGATP